MDQEKVYVQQDWTDEALLNDGFVSYLPVKRITMMRMMSPEKVLPDEKVLSDVENEEDAAAILPPKPRYWLAYRVGSDSASPADEYDSQPIEAQVFAATYRYWDEPDWQPTTSEGHLQRLGCLPYFKFAAVWAKQLTAETWVQSTGSAKPVLAPVGAWLCVGADGEPTTETEDRFQAHYFLPKRRHSARA